LKNIFLITWSIFMSLSLIKSPLINSLWCCFYYCFNVGVKWEMFYICVLYKFSKDLQLFWGGCWCLMARILTIFQNQLFEVRNELLEPFMIQLVHSKARNWQDSHHLSIVYLTSLKSSKLNLTQQNYHPLTYFIHFSTALCVYIYSNEMRSLIFIN
jgi:hypothetical protein